MIWDSAVGGLMSEARQTGSRAGAEVSAAPMTGIGIIVGGNEAVWRGDCNFAGDK